MFVVYGLPLCGECQRVKQVLKERGETVVERDGRLLNAGDDATDLIALEACATYHLQQRTFPVIIEVRSREAGEI